MALQTITNRQFASPSAANSPTVAGVGVSWSNSAWVQLAATTDVVWILTSIIAWTVDGTAATSDFEIDIGIGAPGSEVVIATVRGQHRPQGVAVCSQPIRLMIPIDGLNGRHAFRLRVGNTRTDTWNVAITYIKNPVSGTLLITTKPLKVAPAAAAPITVTASGSAWVNGTWATVIASTAAALVLTHGVLHLDANGVEAVIDIGVGAPGSEAVVTSFRVSSKSTISSSPSVHELPNPLDNIPTGARVSARIRASVGSSTATVALMYHEKPL